MYDIGEPTILALFDKQLGSGSENVGGAGDNQKFYASSKKKDCDLAIEFIWVCIGIMLLFFILIDPLGVCCLLCAACCVLVVVAVVVVVVV